MQAVTDVSFPDAVAERSGHAVADVTRVLAEARVPTSDTVGAPHRLRVTRLAFTGKKAGLLTDDIDFDHANWASARLLGALPPTVELPPTDPTTNPPAEGATSLVKEDPAPLV